MACTHKYRATNQWLYLQLKWDNFPDKGGIFIKVKLYWVWRIIEICMDKWVSRGSLGLPSWIKEANMHKQRQQMATKAHWLFTCDRLNSQLFCNYNLLMVHAGALCQACPHTISQTQLCYFPKHIATVLWHCHFILSAHYYAVNCSIYSEGWRHSFICLLLLRHLSTKGHTSSVMSPQA